MNNRFSFATVAMTFGAFLLGAAASYGFVAKDIAGSGASLPPTGLAGQTQLLRDLREGRETQARSALEQAVWQQVAAHARGVDEGKMPDETLRDAIGYHCAHRSQNQAPLSDSAIQERTQWCATLQSKWLAAKGA